MLDSQKLSASIFALSSLLWSAPKSAISQPILPAADSPETLVNTDGHTTYINGGIQVNQNLFHQFDTFNVESGHTADFVTTNSVQSVIGQVSGGGASYVDGTLQVSGSDADLYLINPAGVLFGPDARLNVGGSFTATTADNVGFGENWLSVGETTDYSDFQQAPTAYRFTADRPGAVVNQGELSVPDHEGIHLVGGAVANTGELNASAGEIALTAVPGESLVRLDAKGALLGVEVDVNTVAAFDFSPLALPELLTGSPAAIATDLLVNSDGSVTLSNLEDAGNSGQLFVSGNLDVSGQSGTQSGGEITLLGSNVDVVGASLSADGAVGGGLIRVGGDYQGKGRGEQQLPTAENVFFDAEGSADGLIDGDGGSIIVWSDGVTQFSGLLSAESAGDGVGGLVETSGLGQLVIGNDANVTTNAENGAVGTWLLDPTDLIIVSSGSSARII
ncbi:MAG: filamentous hemagglutinin N-terminal domain-containing protein, partial [Cyanobacteria bacterium J06632_3]